MEQPNLILCTKCKMIKDVSQMTKRNNNQGYIKRCNTCSNQYNKRYNQKKSIDTIERMNEYFGYKLKNIISQDKKRFPEYVNTLTVEDLIYIFDQYKGKCVYSQKQLDPTGKSSIFENPSFDRLDNTIPHIRGNLQLTSIFMNRLRNNQPHAEFLAKWSEES